MHHSSVSGVRPCVCVGAPACLHAQYSGLCPSHTLSIRKPMYTSYSGLCPSHTLSIQKRMYTSPHAHVNARTCAQVAELWQQYSQQQRPAVGGGGPAPPSPPLGAGSGAQPGLLPPLLTKASADNLLGLLWTSLDEPLAQTLKQVRPGAERLCMCGCTHVHLLKCRIRCTTDT